MNAAQHVLVFLVRVYQWVISPAKGALFGALGQCRFEPSCSHYAVEAIRKHGALKGSALAGWRICRCNPWGGCGEDPVPEKKQVQNLKFKDSVDSDSRASMGTRTMGAAFGKNS